MLPHENVADLDLWMLFDVGIKKLFSKKRSQNSTKETYSSSEAVDFA